MPHAAPIDAAADAPSHALTTGSARLKSLLILGSLSAFGPLSIDLYLPALPSLQSHFHAAADSVQLTLTACLVGLAAGQALAGPLSDSLGRRKPLLIGVAAYALASLLCAFAPSVGALTAGRLIQGFAGAAGIVIARAVVRDLYSGTAMVRFFSTLMLVNGLAPVLAPILGGQLLKVTAWQGLFGVLAAIGAVLLAAVFLGLPESLPASARRAASLGDTLRTFRGLAADRRFLGYALAAGLSFAAMFAYISGSPFVVEQVYRLSPQEFSFMFGANALGLILLGQLNGRLVGRVRTIVLLRAGLVQCAAGGVALLAVTLLGLGFWPTAVCLWFVVASIGLVTPNATALALADHGGNAGTASAFLGVTQFLIGGIVAPLTGPHGTSLMAETLPMALVVAVMGAAALGAHAVLGRTWRAEIRAADTVHQAA
jgi:DHA1 family bicyclomycin/chloramphenicol resistance-like MFS transporter